MATGVVIWQVVLPGMMPFVKVIVSVAVATNVPEPDPLSQVTVEVVPFGTVKPAGRMSVKFTPVNEPELGF